MNGLDTMYMNYIQTIFNARFNTIGNQITGIKKMTDNFCVCYVMYSENKFLWIYATIKLIMLIKLTLFFVNFFKGNGFYNWTEDNSFMIFHY